MRLALVHVSQETNDFNPMPTTLDDFRAFGIYEGAEILRKLADNGQVGGHLAAVAASASPASIETVPILLGLDHHANVTRAMVENATVIVGHRSQPDDSFETGKIGTALLIRILTEGLTSVTAWRKIPLLSHQEKFRTSDGPMKIWFDRARAMEADPRVLQASTYPMQPWLDMAEAGWACIVVTQNDGALAEALADELADLAWSMRDEFQIKEAIPVDDAVRAADAAERGIVVLSDTGDTVLGGAAGDSNVILEAMLRLGIRSKALIPMVSPQAVQHLEKASEGATVTLPLGGEQSGWFKPVTVTGTVRRISDGLVSLGNDRHGEFDMGRPVVFDTGPVTLLISELRGIGGNSPDVYRAFGIEPTEHKIAVLKTAANFQYFAPITLQIIRADTAGPGQSDVVSLPWKRIPRPIYPLDRIADWRDGPGNNPAGREPAAR